MRLVRELTTLYLSQYWALFLKSPETFRAYFGCHNSLYIFATLSLKLPNPLGFSYVKNVLKDQFFKTSGVRFDN